MAFKGNVFLLIIIAYSFCSSRAMADWPDWFPSLEKINTSHNKCKSQNSQIACPETVDKWLIDDKKDGLFGLIESNFKNCTANYNISDIKIRSLLNDKNKFIENADYYLGSLKPEIRKKIISCGKSNSVTDQVSIYRLGKAAYSLKRIESAEDQYLKKIALINQILGKSPTEGIACENPVYSKIKNTCEQLKTQCQSKDKLQELVKTTSKVLSDIEKIENLASGGSSKAKEALNALEIYKSTYPWLFQDTFRKSYKKNSDISRALTEQMNEDRNKLLEKYNEFESGAACVAGVAKSDKNCDPDSLNVLLEKTPEYNPMPEKDRSQWPLAMSAQTCVHDFSVERNKTSKTIGQATVTAALALGTMGLGLAPTLAARGLMMASATGNATLSVQEALHTCTANNISVSSGESGNSCPISSELANLNYSDNSSDCMKSVAWAVVDSVPLAQNFAKVGKVLNTSAKEVKATRVPTVAKKSKETTRNTAAKSRSAATRSSTPKSAKSSSSVPKTTEHYYPSPAKAQKRVSHLAEKYKDKIISGEYKWVNIKDGIHLVVKETGEIIEKIMWASTSTRRNSSAAVLAAAGVIASSSGSDANAETIGADNNQTAFSQGVQSAQQDLQQFSTSLNKVAASSSLPSVSFNSPSLDSTAQRSYEQMLSKEGPSAGNLELSRLTDEITSLRSTLRERDNLNAAEIQKLRNKATELQNQIHTLNYSMDRLKEKVVTHSERLDNLEWKQRNMASSSDGPAQTDKEKITGKKGQPTSIEIYENAKTPSQKSTAVLSLTDAEIVDVIENKILNRELSSQEKEWISASRNIVLDSKRLRSRPKSISDADLKMLTQAGFIKLSPLLSNDKEPAITSP